MPLISTELNAKMVSFIHVYFTIIKTKPHKMRWRMYFPDPEL